MAEVKVPPLLHKMSLASQKAWYKKHGMEMPTAPKEKEPEGKSAAAAKRVKVEPRKTVAVEPGSVRAINAARQKAYMDRGGRQPIGAMGSGGSNVMAGAGQSTIKDLKASIKAGFNPKVSLDPYQSERAKKAKNESVDDAAKRKRMFDLKLKMIKKVANKPALNKPSKFADKPSTAMSPRDDMKLAPKAPSGKGGLYYDEAAKPDASMAMTDTLRKQMISDKDKRTLGKIADLMASQKNKDKKNAYVRSLGVKAMRAGNVDPARGHSPTRFGREVLAKEEVEQIDEIKISDVIAATRGKSPEEKEKIIKAMREKERASKPAPTPRKPEPAKDIPMHQRVYPPDMKYHGDSVELEGPVMNEGRMKNIVTDREETARLKAQDVLGGPVKDKPKGPAGKHPLGYRLARSAARRAMKGAISAVHKSMEKTMAKEEVEQTDEAVKDAADVGEYDYEGDMAKSQLRSILTNAKRLHDMLEDNDNLPEWVQSKITLAEDYILTAANYMDGEMNEEVEQIDEITGYEGAKDRKDMIKRAAAMNRMGKQTFLDRVKTRAAEMKREKAKKELANEAAEGSVPTTPKEKALAAHHGGETKITYGDVIKARLKSAAEKAMKKGN